MATHCLERQAVCAAASAWSMMSGFDEQMTGSNLRFVLFCVGNFKGCGGVEALVAWAIGDRRRLVRHAHETRRVALGRNVHPPRPVACGDKHERRAGDEGEAMPRPGRPVR